jgi:CubicO group peptidase (beta-lactamase class C family)
MNDPAHAGCYRTKVHRTVCLACHGFCEEVEIGRLSRLNRAMNFPARFCLPLAAAIIAQPLAAPGAPVATLPATFDVPAIDAYLSTQVQQASRVGLSVAIVKDGQVVLAKGYGKRSLQDGRPTETDTIFAIGSVSKQFTCACILLLAEDGKLSVKDPVAKYYPNLTRAKDITLLDLMNHVSGYPDYYPLDFVDRRMQRPIAEDELIRQYGGARLDFEPGSKYSYSNTGYILLGRVVETVSGEKFGDFLARRILKPLGMGQTIYEPDYADPRLAKGYTTFALSPPEVVAPEGRGWLCGAGGIYSTPTDLAKWTLALMNGQVLKPESFALMTTPRKLSGGRISDYGCGLSVKTQSGRQVLSHNGAVSGFNASSAMIPSTRSAVIMICNLDGGLGALPGQVFGLLLKEPSVVPIVKASPAAETVKALFAEIQRGRVDRRKLSEEFNLYLTDEKLAGASKRLKPYGTPRGAEVISTHERGGMEVTATRLTFGKDELRTLMYRMPDGKIEQFFVSKE